MDDANFDVVVLPTGNMLVVCQAVIRCVNAGLPINDDERDMADDCILVPRMPNDRDPIPAQEDLNHIACTRKFNRNGMAHCVIMRTDGRAIVINNNAVELYDCLDDFTNGRRPLDSISLECDQHDDVMSQQAV
jgi:hypothetical protein